MKSIVRIMISSVIFTLVASVCYAQIDVQRGTIEIAGSTSLLVNRQSLSPEKDSNGESTTLTNVNGGVELGGYLSPRLGVGALVSVTKTKLTAPDHTVPLDSRGAFFGPLVKLRFAGQGPAAFVVIVSAGGTSITSKSTDLENAQTSGFYWLAGGGFNFALNERAAFEFGLRYQDSRHKPKDSDEKIKAAGLLVGLGFVVYVGGQ